MSAGWWIQSDSHKLAPQGEQAIHPAIVLTNKQKGGGWFKVDSSIDFLRLNYHKLNLTIQIGIKVSWVYPKLSSNNGKMIINLWIWAILFSNKHKYVLSCIPQTARIQTGVRWHILSVPGKAASKIGSMMLHSISNDFNPRGWINHVKPPLFGINSPAFHGKILTTKTSLRLPLHRQCGSQQRRWGRWEGESILKCNANHSGT